MVEVTLEYITACLYIYKYVNIYLYIYIFIFIFIFIYVVTDVVRTLYLCIWSGVLRGFLHPTLV